MSGTLSSSRMPRIPLPDIIRLFTSKLTSVPSGSAPTMRTADKAEATYKAKCAMCHGADGKGETPTGKAMKVNDFASETVQRMSDADLTDAIAKGKMPAFKTLTADQVKDLVAYVRSFGKKQ
jgi:mono/diheme cytochrome c family protein